MAPECVQVKIEIGHKSVCRTDTTQEGFTHDWVVFVRGADNSNISNFVEKVVFHLHESFPKPKRVIKLPPYKVEESGYGSFILSIEIYFRNKEEPKKVKFDYDLYLQLVGNPPVTNVRVEALTFSDPVEDFKKKLLKGGGVIVSPVAAPSISPPAAITNTPVTSNKSEVSMNSQAAFSSPHTSSPPPPPQPINKHPKKTSPSTPVGQQQGGMLSGSKPPKLKEKDTVTSQSTSTNSGLKRSNEDAPYTQKMKKKKLDRSTPTVDSMSRLPKEVSIIGQPADVEKDKVKQSKTANSKKNEDPNARRKSTDLTATTAGLGQEKATKANMKTLKDSSNKKDASKDGMKAKDSKDKVKKLKKAEEKSNVSPDEPKVQKLTVKRTSTDAWSSTAKSGVVGGVGGINGSSSGGGKEKSLDALFNEFGADNSDSLDDDDAIVTSRDNNNRDDAHIHHHLVDSNAITATTKPHHYTASKASRKITAKTSAKVAHNNTGVGSPQVNGVKHKKDISSQ
eukprot:gene10220-11269_t